MTFYNEAAESPSYPGVDQQTPIRESEPRDEDIDEEVEDESTEDVDTPRASMTPGKFIKKKRKRSSSEESSIVDPNHPDAASKSKGPLSNTNKSINVGNEFQAVIEDIVDFDKYCQEAPVKEEVLWDAPNGLDAEKVLEFVRSTSDRYMIPIDKVLFLFMQTKYNYDKTFTEVRERAQLTDVWMDNEKNLMENTFQHVGKNFHHVHAAVSHRSHRSIIGRYYDSKKSIKYKTFVESSKGNGKRFKNRKYSGLKVTSFLYQNMCQNCGEKAESMERNEQTNRIECHACLLHFNLMSVPRPANIRHVFDERLRTQLICPKFLRDLMGSFSRLIATGTGSTYTNRSMVKMESSKDHEKDFNPFIPEDVDADFDEAALLRAVYSTMEDEDIEAPPVLELQVDAESPPEPSSPEVPSEAVTLQIKKEDNKKESSPSSDEVKSEQNVSIKNIEKHSENGCSDESSEKETEKVNGTENGSTKESSEGTVPIQCNGATITEKSTGQSVKTLPDIAQLSNGNGHSSEYSSDGMPTLSSSNLLTNHSEVSAETVSLEKESTDLNAPGSLNMPQTSNQPACSSSGNVPPTVFIWNNRKKTVCLEEIDVLHDDSRRKMFEAGQYTSRINHKKVAEWRNEMRNFRDRVERSNIDIDLNPSFIFSDERMQVAQEWTEQEEQNVMRCFNWYGTHFNDIADVMGTKTTEQISQFYANNQQIIDESRAQYEQYLERETVLADQKKAEWHAARSSK